ncbi:hypothetical protein QBC33DRAFT_523535 [Phialemonium atrogriseum]|uniref:Uncharacterized protein n=1 Tax=Phialemonium atrogriseum TaxID=1093897 RepID=A0AAJ0C751_9PEZI|nr:uncharacterized protein QBC33DRAFT_523535 [Phialemonium atrogriseum]KAK1771380.1 hypothetical protein QBC33DRAFT_523535 [Phialemonium atrogriseum]
MSLPESFIGATPPGMEPSSLIHETENVATTSPSQPKTKTTASPATPLIPGRLRSNSENSSQNKDKRVENHSRELINEETQPSAVLRTWSVNNQIESLNFDVEVNSADDEWVDTLIEGLETISQDLGGRARAVAVRKETEAAESVCIRTTTTTGSVHNLPNRAQPLSTPHSDGMVAVVGDRPVTRTSTPPIPGSANWTSSGSDRPPARMTGDDFDLLASPPRLPQNFWPSIMSPTQQPTGRPTRPLGSATTSARQLTPTKDRSGRLCQRASGVSRAAVAPAQIDAFRTETEIIPLRRREGAPPATVSPLYMSTGRRNRSCSLPAAGSPTNQPRLEKSRINEVIARGAAKQAIVKYDAAAAKRAPVQRGGGTRASSVQPQGNKDWSTKSYAQDGEGGIDDRSRNRARMSGTVRFERARRSLVAARRALDVVGRFVRAYWVIVSPVFDPASPISLRFSRSQSTWMDCVVYLLALVFILSAVLVGAWAVKGFLVVSSILKALVRGFMLLLDL